MDERCRVSRTATTCRKCHSVQKRLNKVTKHLSYCCCYHISDFVYCNTFGFHHLGYNGYLFLLDYYCFLNRCLRYLKVCRFQRKAEACFELMNLIWLLLNHNASFHCSSMWLIYFVQYRSISQPLYQRGPFRHFHILLPQVSIFAQLRIFFVSYCKKCCQFGPYIVRCCIV